MNYLDKLMNYLENGAVLSKLGLERKPSTGSRIAATFGLIGVGMLVGVGTALFLAPMRGRDLRDRVRRIRRNGIGEGFKVADESGSSPKEALGAAH